MSFNNRIKVTSLVIIITIIISSLIFIQLPFESELGKELQNTGHIVASGILAIIFLRLIKQLATKQRRKTLILYFSALVAAMLCGVLVELVQIYTDRDADINDVYRNIIGIVSFLVIYASFDGNFTFFNSIHCLLRKRIVFFISGVLILFIGAIPLINIIIAYWQRHNAFPVIIDFDSKWSSKFYYLNNATIEVGEKGDMSKSRLYTTGLIFRKGEYSGINIFETVENWSSRSFLAFDVFLESSAPLVIYLRIHDKQHNNEVTDRFNLKEALRQGDNTIRISLSDIQHGPLYRELDMASVDGLVLFVKDVKTERKILLSNITLE